MSTSTLTSKGQITLPKAIRDRLNLHAGDRLSFVLEPDGTIRIVPLMTSIRELKGIVPAPRQSVSLEEMDEAITHGILRQ